MAGLSNFFLNVFSDALETVGESKLLDVLQKLHDSNLDAYKSAIYGGHALVTALNPVVGKTGTKIDDAIITALDEAIKESAARNGVAL